MNYNKKHKKNEFQGADFHVHTPASNCYKGLKNDDEYIKILRRYYEKNIKIIAITDHNTLKGYKKIMDIKRNIYNNAEYLAKLCEKYPDLNEEYEKVKEDLILFDEMIILPGVECDVDPGIHIILVFNPENNIDEYERFLIDKGYSEDLQGSELVENCVDIDVKEILEHSNLLGAISIAAHADSNKGIYNDLKGTYRASIFKSPYLDAISYNNPKNCQKMKALYQQKDYSREDEIAYIQASDYHGESEVGKSITYLKIEGRDFESIKKAFKNPLECISATERPEVINILNKLVGDEKSICIQLLDDNEIKRSMCALLNRGYGTLIIGAYKEPSSTIIGVKINEEKAIEFLLATLKEFNVLHNLNINIYPYGNEAFVIVIKLEKIMRRLYCSDDKVYIIHKKNIEVATPKQIEVMVENNILEKLKEHQSVVNPRVQESINQLSLYNNISEQFIIINKLAKSNIRLLDLFNIEIIRKCEKSNVSLETYDGESSGNVYVVDRAFVRLEYSYLRCSCPRTAKYDETEFESKKFQGEAIVIVPGGGVYYIDNDETWTIFMMDTVKPCLVLQLDDMYRESISTLSVVLWLKSSLLLWHIGITKGDVDIYTPLILNKIVLPKKKLLLKGERLEQLGKIILENEKEFLDLNMDKLEKEEIHDRIVSHNKRVDSLAKQIDNEIFCEYSITDEQIELVSSFFNHKKIYNLISIDCEYEQMEDEVPTASA